MITLEVDGARFEGFTSISVTRSLGSVSGHFFFGVTSSKRVDLPIRIGNTCKVLIGDITVINGFIENTSMSYTASDHSMSIEGRDKTMDVIDSSIGGVKELSGTISLSQLIKNVLKANDISGIDVVDTIGDLLPFTDGDIQSAEVGETIFSFIERYSQKRQVLLTGDGEGNIVIARAGTASTLTSLLNVIGGENNNILSGSSSYSETNLFNKYTVISQQNPVALNKVGDLPSAQVVNQSGVVVDKEIRKTRTLEIRPEQSGSSDDSKQFALWTRNLRRAKSFNHFVTVEGHYQDKEKTSLWIPNEVVLIKDDFAGIDSHLLIDTVTYSVDSDGAKTAIKLVNTDVYTLQSEIDERESRANKTGTGIE